MEEARREELGLIAKHFAGQKAVTNEAIAEYCKRRKIEPITKGDLSDYIAQVEHDDVVSELYPKVLVEVQKLRYVPEFATAKERAELKEANDEVRVNITKLFEKVGVRYELAEPIGAEMGDLIGRTVASAGNTAFNKATEVLLHIVSKHFGDNHFTMAHAEKYAREVFEAEEEKKNKEKAEQEEAEGVDNEAGKVVL